MVVPFEAGVVCPWTGGTRTGARHRTVAPGRRAFIRCSRRLQPPWARDGSVAARAGIERTRQRPHETREAPRHPERPPGGGHERARALLALARPGDVRRALLD